MTAESPTPDHLLSLLVTIVANATGKQEGHWRPLMTIEPVQPAHNPRTNWRIAGNPGRDDGNAIERASEIARLHHPYIQW